MPVVVAIGAALAVEVAGAAIASAVGSALVGEAIAGAIGGAIAGGVSSAIQGGDFMEGFTAGAVSGGIAGAAGGLLDGLGGATEAATTVEPTLSAVSDTAAASTPTNMSLDPTAKTSLLDNITAKPEMSPTPQLGTNAGELNKIAGLGYTEAATPTVQSSQAVQAGVAPGLGNLGTTNSAVQSNAFGNAVGGGNTLQNAFKSVMGKSSPAQLAGSVFDTAMRANAFNTAKNQANALADRYNTNYAGLSNLGNTMIASRQKNANETQARMTEIMKKWGAV